MSRGRIGVNCPYCDDTGYHAAFLPDGSSYSCWRCNGSSPAKALQALSGLSWHEYQTVIEDYNGTGEIYRHLNKRANSKSLEMIGIPLIPHDRNYLRRRGFDPDYLAKKYQLRSGGIAGDWAYRIIIPIFYQGRLVSWQGRDTTGDENRIRYKTLSIEESVVDPKSVLYNLDNCAKDYIGVVEGVFGCLRLENDFCATLGTSMTEAQVRILAQYKRVVFIFDSEVEAQKRAKKFAAEVAAFGVEVQVVDLETGERDCADLTEKEVFDLRKALDFI